MRRAREYEQLYATIMRTQPGLEYYLHADDTKSDDFTFSEYDAWKHLADAWQKEGLKLNFFKLDPKDFPESTDENRLNEDEWTRDYGPNSVKRGDETQYVSIGKRGSLVNDYVGDARLVAVKHVENSLYEGGNLMATSQGICSTAIDDKSATAASWIDRNKTLFIDILGCKDVIAVPPLPNESTRHVDLFAKFMSDDRVLLADYRSNDVLFDAKAYLVTYNCSAEQIVQAEWYNCNANSGVSYPLQDVPSMIRSEQDFNDLIKSHFRSVILKHPYHHGDLVKHSQDMRATYARYGFSVSTVPAPQPSLSLGIGRFMDANGKVVREELSLNFNHKSFVNSLLLNGQVYVPTYADTAAMNEQALAAYQSFGVKTHAIDMTETIKAGGAVHCLSKDLH